MHCFKACVISWVAELLTRPEVILSPGQIRVKSYGRWRSFPTTGPPPRPRPPPVSRPTQESVLSCLVLMWILLVQELTTPDSIRRTKKEGRSKRISASLTLQTTYHDFVVTTLKYASRYSLNCNFSATLLRLQLHFYNPVDLAGMQYQVYNVQVAFIAW